MQEQLANIERELSYRVAQTRESQRNDRPIWSANTVAYYRELYQQPNMTTEQVKALEESRVRDNRIIAESDIQSLEHLQAYWELKANRS